MKLLRATYTCLLTAIVYLGASLLGWGFGDLSGYFSSGPRLAHALLVGGFAVAVAVQAYASIDGIRGRRGDADKRVGRQTVTTIVMVVCMYAALVWLPYADRRGIAVLTSGASMRWAGVIASAGGFTLVFWSGLALGSMYSKEVTIQDDHQLVTSGLYQRIRHPRYLGVLLMALGLALIYRSWVGLIAFALLIPLLLVRIRDEERVLRSEFGEAWDAYVARSWRMVPRVF